MWVLALLAFAIAAFLALAGVSGVTLTTIIGIGLALLALEVGKWTPPWPRR